MTNRPPLDGNTELIICQHLVAELEDYLQAEVLYWPVTGANPLGNHMPQLTIGALLEATVRAEAGGAEPQAVAAVRAQHDRLRAAQPTLYSRKALHELRSRLTAWQANLQDYAQPKAQPVYAQDVRVRAKAHLLEQALGTDVPLELQRDRAQLDQQLFTRFVPGDFVWDARLMAFFPRDPCWWLYGHLFEGRS